MATSEILSARKSPVPDAVSKLVGLLASEQAFSSIEIAETLWLAMQMEPAREVEEDQRQAKKKSVRDRPSVDEAPSTSQAPLPPPQKPAAPRANLSAIAPEVKALPTQVLPVWIADPSMLRDPLAVMRSLKPLLEQRETGVGKRLDESATVEGIARTRLWLPVLAPEKEPWFDLVLVVDRSASMQLWQGFVGDLERMFKRYGAFRNLQVFDLAVNAEATADAVRLKAHPIKSELPGHRPSELIEQRGRRIVMVLSDCAADYWWNGKLLPMLQDWAAVMPTVVWQMLPQWMWARTALGRGKAVSLSNGIPGVANRRLMPYALGREMLSFEDRKLSPIPVVTSEPRDLNNWGLMLSGDRRELTPGFLMPPGQGVVPRALSIEEMAYERARQTEAENIDAIAIEVQISEIAQARIDRFLALSSPSARRLLVLLAAAPVITLPVMRLIRDSMMADGVPDGQSTLPVAEVFMSGLIRQLPQETAASNTLILDTNLMQYDLVPKVRNLLLEYLPEADTLEVVNRVSAAVEKQWNRYSDQKFRAFLTDPQVQESALAGVRSFASVTAEILEPLGGDYADFVQQLREGANAKAEVPQIRRDADDFEIPPLRTLEFDQAMLREEAPLVQLLVDEFTVATVELEAAPSIEELLVEIAGIEEELEKAAALIDLAPQLEGAAFSFLVRVVKVAQDISGERERLSVFDALLPYLPDRLQVQMRETIVDLKRPVKIFFSYARADREICDRLIDHLSPLEATGDAALWRDHTVAYGENFEVSIRQKLNAADIILLLISSSYLGSDFCYNTEVPIALERSETDNATVIPIILRAVDWEGLPFSHLSVLPPNGQPIEAWGMEAEALTAVAKGIKERIREISQVWEEEKQAQLRESTAELEHGVRIELVEFEFEVARVVRQKRVGASVPFLLSGWEVQRDRQTAYRYVERLGKAIELPMVAIPAGTFVMGSPKSEKQRSDRESPHHEVKLSAFCMGQYPVTQAQWRFVAALEPIEQALEPDPSRFKGDSRPVEKVSWNEAVEFCNRLSQHTGNQYGLPSEAQWEYACRAGTTTPFHFGGTILPELSNYRCSESYDGGATETHRQEITPVGEFETANAFGLYGMHGNVWEWCADQWLGNYEGAPVDGKAWLTDKKDANRLLRGGSWNDYPRHCRSAFRYYYWPDDRNDTIGFRVSSLFQRTLPPSAD